MNKPGREHEANNIVGLEHGYTALTKDGAKVETTKFELKGKITEEEGNGDIKSKNFSFVSEVPINMNAVEEGIKGCNCSVQPV